MNKKLAICVATALLVTACGAYLAAETAPKPLRKSEILALVSGAIISENVAYDIRSRGISFVPDDTFTRLLQVAGADEAVLAALNTAKSPSPSKADGDSDQSLLPHLSHAGSLIRAGQSEAAATELNNSMANGAGRSAIGFVMGKILIDQQRIDEAGQVYSQILRQDPDFPEVHTRLSFAYMQSGDAENALREAKAALKQNPGNAVAHMNAGLALREMGNFDAAKAEFQESVRSKPDYSLAYMNLGILLDDMKDMDGAIVQFKRAIALNPGDANAHFNLGVSYGDKSDYLAAINEYRQVKRLDPTRLDARQNLGSALIHTDAGASITEFRELIALAPDFAICRECLATALYSSGRYSEAEAEYQAAIAIDPSHPGPYNGLGLIAEVAKKYDQAIAEYHKAEHIDPTFVEPYRNAGRVLLLKKDFPAAIAELKHAEDMEPGNATNHDLHGQALEGSGDRDTAVAEYKVSVTLAPKDLQGRLDLALALEKKGDWVGALGNYRQAALDEPALKPGTAQIRFDAQNKLATAKERFRRHIGNLRSSGKAPEAADLEAKLRASDASPGLDAKYHDAIQSSMKAVQERRFDDAETAAKQAIDVAEKMQPQDGRLPDAVGQLGNAYAWRRENRLAEEAYQRQLVLSEKVYGDQSPSVVPALQNLAMLSLAEKDFTAAEHFFNRSGDLNLKTYGENSQAVADTLRGLAHVYSVQQNFAKSESTLLRATKIYETMYGPEDSRVAIPLASLCSTYDQWGQAEKSAPCHARLAILTGQHASQLNSN
jgi:tetratricopeptide (TPR) repeat protein